MHNNEGDCWTIINGGVYNLTSWIHEHPGGAQAILGLCGKDGSTAFNAQHGGQARPENELSSFKIGILAN
jgi:cytochrome b involved in lipid metabolism